MLSKSIQGPVALCLTLLACSAGAFGAPSSSAQRGFAREAHGEAFTFEQSEQRPSTPMFSQAGRGRSDSGHSARLVEGSVRGFKRYEPLAAADLVTHSIDGATSTVALRGSIGSDASLRYSIVEAPRHGAVTLQDGRATYTPDPEFEGVDIYTYRVHAGDASADAVVAVTSIRGRALPPTAAAAL
ncbi:Ig-like domain-containing protein [Lysobacter sp. CA196]|uniref:Ig-like domain-containing protein n=1 Tax=Lysobacter sp. CA196 TaxID=3455606 RepID=UPI003F8D3D06